MYDVEGVESTRQRLSPCASEGAGSKSSSGKPLSTGLGSYAPDGCDSPRCFFSDDPRSQSPDPCGPEVEGKGSGREKTVVNKWSVPSRLPPSPPQSRRPRATTTTTTTGSPAWSAGSLLTGAAARLWSTSPAARPSTSYTPSGPSRPSPPSFQFPRLSPTHTAECGP